MKRGRRGSGRRTGESRCGRCGARPCPASARRSPSSSRCRSACRRDSRSTISPRRKCTSEMHVLQVEVLGGALGFFGSMAKRSVFFCAGSEWQSTQLSPKTMSATCEFSSSWRSSLRCCGARHRCRRRRPWRSSRARRGPASSARLRSASPSTGLPSSSFSSKSDSIESGSVPSSFAAVLAQRLGGSRRASRRQASRRPAGPPRRPPPPAGRGRSLPTPSPARVCAIVALVTTASASADGAREQVVDVQQAVQHHVQQRRHREEQPAAPCRPSTAAG